MFEMLSADFHPNSSQNIESKSEKSFETILINSVIHKL